MTVRVSDPAAPGHHLEEEQRLAHVAQAIECRAQQIVEGQLLLDGDLLAIMETLYREVTAKRELNRSFEEMTSEITHLIDQMSDAERREHLV